MTEQWESRQVMFRELRLQIIQFMTARIPEFQWDMDGQVRKIR